MTKFAAIKGFVFDLDGVIADTSVYHAQAWHQLATELGVAWNDELADDLKGVSRMDSLELILKAGGKTDAYTQAEKEAYATKKNDNYLALLKNMDASAILPGIADFLADLKKHDYQLSLASASKNSPLVLEQLGLADYFSARVDPATLKHGKPDPEIFARGAAILNLRPDECIGVEDAKAGVQSINAAGETSIGIGDLQTLAAADINFTSTKDLTLANIEQALA
ncbi:beta-phosphoglucomutase [Lactiplantibacillus fabifermentans]|uniref:Beta-phosphoglucomutase n=2 Tax=Lactiplantibacillus fabifermentans TaxID=483011 RepID=A0A0R2NNX7_9LACO|nr:beta-phosphoglucomutase [Lactiplantibacillus fabifermentans]ETY75573.1 beta-phosphoglucomutase [Lactiplantibacillus fabifermentans T30PCM01]KRO26411.1 beta-phosphoglucomutase [Lactiplantibacillus fabifermentans DSM 21115]